MLATANIFFFIFHTALILFNVFGWIPRATRRWNFVTLLLTLISWTVMGLRYGMGYCICTDWHWQIRHAMGIRDDPDSYIILLTQKLTGWTPATSLANTVAMWTFIVCFAASISLNLRDLSRKRRAAI